MGIRTRKQWGAQVSLRKNRDGEVTMMTLPAKTLYIHHSVTNITNDPDADIRTIERIGKNRFGYFSYSFASHPRQDDVYEGAGLSIGAHTSQRNSNNFGLVFVGNYDTIPLLPLQFRHAQWLYWHLIDEGHLIPNADIKPHMSVVATGCPGKRIMSQWEELVDTIRRRPHTEPKSEPRPVEAEPTLVRGMAGPTVRRVQTIIQNKAGGNITVDGDFGPKTEQRVMDLQRFFGLGVDGIVGSKTWAVLKFLESL